MGLLYWIINFFNTENRQPNSERYMVSAVVKGFLFFGIVEFTTWLYCFRLLSYSK